MDNKCGSVLLMCLYIIGALAIIGSGFSLEMVNEKLSTQHNIQSVQAMYLAEAGLEKAVYDLRQDYMQSANWNDGVINGMTVNPASNLYYPLYSNVNFGPGQYTVQIENDISATDKIWVKSTGFSGQ
ncbi:MAG: hypothetical protein ACRDE5_09570, partial [Ginsengibacter sp.]